MKIVTLRKINKSPYTYTFHQWKKQLLIIDKVVVLFLFLLLGVFRADYVVIAGYLFLFFYLIITHRTSLFYHLLVSSILALLWMLYAKGEYGYNSTFLTLWGMNVFSLFAWANGLLAVYILFSHYEHLLHTQHMVFRIIIFCLFYWILLISVETVAYYVFHIRNVASAAYSGLPVCQCIHAPRWMQAAYLLMGPLFYVLCYFLRLENPHMLECTNRYISEVK